MPPNLERTTLFGALAGRQVLSWAGGRAGVGTPQGGGVAGPRAGTGAVMAAAPSTRPHWAPLGQGWRAGRVAVMLSSPLPPRE